ncbi:MAG: carboxy terminal-processing peptidase [Bacteroidales bacterium]|nr:carboxy terminal-processing peptidase [Bacteroidales bacterium]
MRKKHIPIYIIILFSFIVSFTSDNNDNRKNKLILEIMKQSLRTYHYYEHKFDNEFSEEVFHLYLEKMDYNKRFFLQSDINTFAAYKYKIDEAVKDADFTFFKLTKDTYIERVKEVDKYIEAALKKPFDFTEDEFIEIDSEKRNFAESKKELKQNWEKYLKHSVMTKLATKLKIQEKAKKDNDTTIEIKTFEELEKKAREEVKKTYEDWYHRMTKIDEKDLLRMYFNSVAGFFDPHTSYFPPKDKENFDIRISGKLEGIGATLSQPNAYIKVERIVAGSACWKQGELEVGDLILKVAQGADEPVDVVDMRLDEAIKMIRGKKGTEVRLTVKKADGSIHIIPIIRDVVILEETFAKSIVIQDSISGKKIGYIYLPQFYADFEDKNGRRSSVDVKKEVEKLKKEDIEGIIIDLRSNGGGSLIDAIDIVGLFIDKGPVVQVRSRFGMPEVLKDKKAGTLYDGKLLVMVNEFSASASEIMAAAIQDYARGVIVGSKSTFGKGTVQRFIPFDQMTRSNDDLKPLGHLKITIQKFYRINGGATQLKGVEPDIVLPDAYSKMDMGEKDMDNPIEWDEIPKAEYSVFNTNINFEKIKQKSNNRVSADTSFIIIDEYSDYLKKSQDETLLTLNLNKYRKEQENKSKINKRFRNADRRISGLKFYVSRVDSLKVYSDTIKIDRVKSWIKNLKKDIYLEESYRIINDMN